MYKPQNKVTNYGLINKVGACSSAPWPVLLEMYVALQSNLDIQFTLILLFEYNTNKRKNEGYDKRGKNSGTHRPTLA